MKLQNPSLNFFLNGRTDGHTDAQAESNMLPTFFKVGGINRTTIESRMSLKFGKIQPPTAELAALVRLERSPLTYNGRNAVTIFNWIFIILAGKNDVDKSLDEFQNPTRFVH